MRPRPLAVAPLIITQLNALAVVGIDGRRFLELVRRAKVPHTRLPGSKLVAVEAAVFLERLRELGESADGAAVVELDTRTRDDEQPQTADDVLRAIGRRRTA